MTVYDSYNDSDLQSLVDCDVKPTWAPYLGVITDIQGEYVTFAYERAFYFYYRGTGSSEPKFDKLSVPIIEEKTLNRSEFKQSAKKTSRFFYGLLDRFNESSHKWETVCWSYEPHTYEFKLITYTGSLNCLNDCIYETRSSLLNNRLALAYDYFKKETEIEISHFQINEVFIFSVIKSKTQFTITELGKGCGGKHGDISGNKQFVKMYHTLEGNHLLNATSLPQKEYCMKLFKIIQKIYQTRRK